MEQQPVREEDLWESSTPEETSAEELEDVVFSSAAANPRKAGETPATAAGGRAAGGGEEVAAGGGGEVAAKGGGRGGKAREGKEGSSSSRGRLVARAFWAARAYRALTVFFDSKEGKRGEERRAAGDEGGATKKESGEGEEEKQQRFKKNEKKDVEEAEEGREWAVKGKGQEVDEHVQLERVLSCMAVDDEEGLKEKKYITSEGTRDELQKTGEESSSAEASLRGGDETGFPLFSAAVAVAALTTESDPRQQAELSSSSFSSSSSSAALLEEQPRHSAAAAIAADAASSRWRRVSEGQQQAAPANGDEKAAAAAAATERASASPVKGGEEDTIAVFVKDRNAAACDGEGRESAFLLPTAFPKESSAAALASSWGFAAARFAAASSSSPSSSSACPPSLFSAPHGRGEEAALLISTLSLTASPTVHTVAFSNATGTTAATGSGWRPLRMLHSKASGGGQLLQQQQKRRKTKQQQRQRSALLRRCVPSVPESCPVACALLAGLLVAQENLVAAQAETTQLTHAKIKRLLACQRLLQRRRSLAAQASLQRWVDMRERDERREMGDEDFDAPFSHTARQQLFLRAFLELVCMQVRLREQWSRKGGKGGGEDPGEEGGEGVRKGGGEEEGETEKHEEKKREGKEENAEKEKKVKEEEEAKEGGKHKGIQEEEGEGEKKSVASAAWFDAEHFSLLVDQWITTEDEALLGEYLKTSKQAKKRTQRLRGSRGSFVLLDRTATGATQGSERGSVASIARADRGGEAAERSEAAADGGGGEGEHGEEAGGEERAVGRKEAEAGRTDREDGAAAAGKSREGIRAEEGEEARGGEGRKREDFQGRIGGGGRSDVTLANAVPFEEQRRGKKKIKKQKKRGYLLGAAVRAATTKGEDDVAETTEQEEKGYERGDAEGSAAAGEVKGDTRMTLWPHDGGQSSLEPKAVWVDAAAGRGTRRGRSCESSIRETESEESRSAVREQLHAHRNLIRDLRQAFSFLLPFRGRGGRDALAARKKLKKAEIEEEKEEEEEEEGENDKKQQPPGKTGKRKDLVRRGFRAAAKAIKREDVSMYTTCASEGFRKEEDDEEERAAAAAAILREQRQQQRRAEKLMRREFRRLIRMGSNTFHWPPEEEAEAAREGGGGRELEILAALNENAAKKAGERGRGGWVQQDARGAERGGERTGEEGTTQKAETLPWREIGGGGEGEEGGRSAAAPATAARLPSGGSEEAYIVQGETQFFPWSERWLSEPDLLRAASKVEDAAFVAGGSRSNSGGGRRRSSSSGCGDKRAPQQEKDVLELLVCTVSSGEDEEEERRGSLTADRVERRSEEQTATEQPEEEVQKQPQEGAKANGTAANGAATSKADVEGPEEGEEENVEEEVVRPVDEEITRGATQQLAKLLLQQRLLLRKQACLALQHERDEKCRQAASRQHRRETADLQQLKITEAGGEALRKEQEKEKEEWKQQRGEKETGGEHLAVLQESCASVGKATEINQIGSSVAAAAAGQETAAADGEEEDDASSLRHHRAATGGAAEAVAANAAAAAAAEQEQRPRHKQQEQQSQRSSLSEPPLLTQRSWKNTWEEMKRRGYAVLAGPPTASDRFDVCRRGEGDEGGATVAKEWAYPPVSAQQPLILLQDCDFRFVQRRLEEQRKQQYTKESLFKLLKEMLLLSPEARKKKREAQYQNFTILCSPYPTPIDLPPRFSFAGRPAAEVVFVTSTLSVRKHTYFNCLRLSHFLACKAIVYYQIDASVDACAATPGAADTRLLRRWKRQRILRNAPHTHHRGVLVPQLVVDGQSVGSYDEVLKLEDDGLFDVLIARGRCPTCLQPRRRELIKCLACGNSFRELLSLRRQHEGQITEMYRGRPTRSAPVFKTRVDALTSWELYYGSCGACGSSRRADDPFCPQCHLSTRDIALAKVLGLGICRSGTCSQCGKPAGKVEDLLEPLPREANPFTGKPVGGSYMTSRASPLCDACGNLLTYLLPVKKKLFPASFHSFCEQLASSDHKWKAADAPAARDEDSSSSGLSSSSSSSGTSSGSGGSGGSGGGSSGGSGNGSDSGGGGGGTAAEKQDGELGDSQQVEQTQQPQAEDDEQQQWWGALCGEGSGRAAGGQGDGGEALPQQQQAMGGE